LRSGPVARRLATLLSMLAVADESDDTDMANVQSANSSIEWRS
jgi:hypothetical protein